MLRNGWKKDTQAQYKVYDSDKVFGNPKSSFVINAYICIINTKSADIITVIYINRQTGKEMHVKYHVYQQLEANEHKSKFNMTHAILWRVVEIQCLIIWGTLKIDIELFSFLFALTTISIYIACFIAINLIHTLRSMWSPVFEIQYDGGYVRIDRCNKNHLFVN